MTKFNIEKVNQKIVEYRNYEVNKSWQKKYNV
jgi:hypothetical protein